MHGCALNSHQVIEAIRLELGEDPVCALIIVSPEKVPKLFVHELFGSLFFEMKIHIRLPV
jgi:hypothetical protein